MIDLFSAAVNEGQQPSEPTTLKKPTIPPLSLSLSQV